MGEAETQPIDRLRAILTADPDEFTKRMREIEKKVARTSQQLRRLGKRLERHLPKERAAQARSRSRS